MTQRGIVGLQDLYVMRRAVGVYERIIRRFTAQDTDYQLLLSTFAEGLYTEMDFRNEALNMQRMTSLMQQSEFGGRGVMIPQPVMDRTTRWVKHTSGTFHHVKTTCETQKQKLNKRKVGFCQENAACDASICFTPSVVRASLTTDLLGLLDNLLASETAWGTL